MDRCLCPVTGWEVAVSFAGLQDHWRSYHAWSVTITNNVGGVEVHSLGLATPASGAPDAARALGVAGYWLGQGAFAPQVPDDIAQYLSRAVSVLAVSA